MTIRNITYYTLRRFKVKRRVLMRRLKGAGWRIEHGGKHDIAVHPSLPTFLVLPRHKEINENTARGILKKAGLL